ncbi:3'-5' exonuclease [Reinekea blandensis]|uniref:DNA polymerase III subunit epsilon n=1 Tax=Reinekea blandensis MED297 TaxID=314283 RepID=A4B904_9GAMM|nr:3'-5' exonuclease [Reinekea blandensis]EAR11105.1 DNA polymerase III subunit epsilon [Reinekea sp. MED297] [Reinekea blandensis MED297]
MLYPYQTLPDDWDDFLFEQVSEQQPPALQAFYQQPWVEPDLLVGDAEFVAVDIETTGLNAEQDDIISIGLVPFTAQRITLAKARHWLVRTRNLTSESVVVHRITHSDIAQAPPLRAVLSEVIPCLQGRQVVVHYRYMEREFFRQSVAGLHESTWLFPVIDTLELEAAHLRQKQSIVSRLFKQTLPSLRLPNVRERYNLPAYENHNALTDALATAELLQAQVAKQNLVDKPVRSLWY